MDVITYPCPNLHKTMLAKRAPDLLFTYHAYELMLIFRVDQME